MAGVVALGLGLVALLPGESQVQGKFDVPPLGKSGAPSVLLAGSTFAVVVYGVDQYYNTDPAAGIQVSADITTDPYDISPAPQSLVDGSTTFIFTPVVAAAHIIKAESSALPTATSAYFTPNPAINVGSR